MALLLMLPSRGFALDPTKSVFQFNCQNWTRQNGLPADKVNSIVQTQDGYLWLATQNGLVRFDGLEFKTIPITLPQARGNNVRALSRSRDGSLWFAINAGGFGRYDGQNFSAAEDERLNRSDTSIEAIMEARDGALWLGETLAVDRWVKGKPGESLIGEVMPGPVITLCEGAAGTIWLGTAEHGLFYWSGGKVTPFPDEQLKGRDIFAMAVDAQSQLWVGTGNGLTCYGTNGQTQAIDPLNYEIKALLLDRHGVMWVGTTGLGLGRYENGQFTFLKKVDGLGSDNVTSLCEDAEGSLWVGTQDGLSQVSDLKFPVGSSREGIGAGSCIAVAAATNGGVWIATGSGLSYFDGHTGTNYNAANLLPNSYIKLVFQARDGTLYVQDGSKIINVISGGQLLARLTNSTWADALAEDDESVLLGSGGSLLRIQDGKLNPYQFQNGLAPDYYWINRLCVAKDGAIWVACNNGIFRIKDGTFKHWAAAEGLAGGIALWVCEDMDGSIWAGLPAGIARIKDGEVKNILAENGLPGGRINAIVPDDHGYFWCDSGRGIFRASRQSLNDFADGKTNQVECELFDGLESVKFTDRTDQENSGCKSLDGRIWFPCPWGVVMIDPANIPTNAVAPPVHIERVLANGKEFSPDDNIVVPPGAGDLEIHFTALSFIAPQKNQLRYQLVGYDRDWVDSGGRRIAFYTNLKPGAYTFRVIAANDDGVWNREGDEIAIHLRPFFYQTGWFYSGCGGLVLIGLGGIYRGHVGRIKSKERNLKEAQIQLERRVAERTAELAESLSILNATLGSTTDGILVLNTKSEKIFQNQRAIDLWKIPPHIVASNDGKAQLQHVISLVVNPDQFLAKINYFTAHPGESGQVQTELKDGTILDRFTAPVLGKDGRIYGRIWMFRDVTESRKYEAALAYERDLLRELLENSPDHIYFKDAQSRFIKSSNAQARQFGAFTAADLVGKSDFDFFSEDHARPAFEDEQKIVRTGQPIIGKIEKECWKDGRRESWVITTKMPLRNNAGAIIGTFGISKDITPIKEAEAQLKDVHERLLETSRLAGMAEVATNVLHNVGNVLNSVNVSASLMADNVKKSNVRQLAKVVALLNEHAADLGTFITTDPRGRQLPGYLSQLAAQLDHEQQNSIAELDLLRQNIEHIKEIVAMQQNYAKISGVTETIDVTELVEDALRMNAGALARHEVELARAYSVVPPVTVEKHKVLQILVNLIRNAKYACDDSGRSDKQLKLEVAPTADGVRISVVDNGIGISPENLTRIFSHGFTTRKGGHGFGLHGGALAAGDLGGSLTVHSSGVGQGATFTLNLPLQPPER
jgi:PAS domain S-box-containing protein